MRFSLPPMLWISKLRCVYHNLNELGTLGGFMISPHSMTDDEEGENARGDKVRLGD